MRKTDVAKYFPWSERLKFLAAILTFSAGLLIATIIVRSAKVYLTNDQRGTGETTADIRKTVVTSPEKPVFYDQIGGASPAIQNKSPAAEVEKYTLELKLLHSKAETERYLDSLAKSGITAFYTPLQREGRVVFRVRRGLYDKLDEAKKDAENLRQAHNISAKAVRLN